MFAMASTSIQSASASRLSRRKLVAAAAGIAVIGAIAFDTTVVTIGGEGDLRQQAFNPDRFGEGEFPRIRDYVTGKAPDAAVLAEELTADKDAAVASYGTMAGAFPVMPVTFTGTVGEGSSGIFNVDVEGLPEGSAIRVQTGPAINGTELRELATELRQRQS